MVFQFINFFKGLKYLFNNLTLNDLQRFKVIFKIKIELGKYQALLVALKIELSNFIQDFNLLNTLFMNYKLRKK